MAEPTCDTGLNITRAVDPSIDLGNLLVDEQEPVDQHLMKENTEMAVMNKVRESVQLMANKLWELPTQRIEDAIVVELPAPTSRLPREKPIPKKAPPTKWEEFAKMKGIQKRKRTRMIWDEAAQDWKPRWGYNRANDNTKDWLIEIPRQKDPYVDYFGERKEAKKERIAKNELRRLKNISRRVKGSSSSVLSSLPHIGVGLESVAHKVERARLATASMGKFAEKLRGEKAPKNKGKKNKFLPNEISAQEEKDRYFQTLKAMQSKTEILNVNKAIKIQNQAEEQKNRERNAENGKDGKAKKKVSKTKIKQMARYRGKGNFSGKGRKEKALAQTRFDIAMDKLSNFYMKINDENKLVFENLEQNVLPFIQFTENIICRWHSIEEENNSLLSLNRRYEQEVEGNRKKVKELKAELMEARSQIAALMAGKQALVSEKQCLEDQIELVREMLKDDEYAIPEQSRKRLQFLTEKSRYENTKCISISTDEQGSIASTTGIDYDQTDDSLDRKMTFLPTSRPGRKTSINLERKRSRSAGRVEPSAPPLEEEDQYLCKKRSKDDLQIDRAKPATIITKTTLTVPCSVISGMPEVKTTTTRRLSMNKSASEPHLLEFTPTLSAVHPNLLKSQPTLGQTPTTPKTPTGDSIPSRRHFFATKTVLKPENCDVCAKRIVFGKLILRCNDCKTQCHQECRMGAVVPCIARTPMARRAHGKLSDYVPPQGPFIPHVVVHCVNEIERRGIDAVGLYRVPGTETKIADLLAKFLSDRGVPNLKVIDDINVLTGCLKRFFHQLKEPLIPLTSKQDFINAAILETDFLMQMKRVHSAVMELPYPNRDTLCFLIMHLQRVAEASASNKMPAENLAKIFGPTVLGVSDQCDQNVARMLDDASKAEKVMLILLSVPYGYWMQFLPVSQGQPLRSSSPVERSAMPATNAGGRFDSNRITSGATPGNGLRSRQTGMMKKDYYPPWHCPISQCCRQEISSYLFSRRPFHICCILNAETILYLAIFSTP
ncbi:Ribosome biogenesis regulatory -like protein [Trichinella nelsoni]|uniref:Ribosome biogenesis regulatory-like protein n=1 Tax=Trichinella nelsoni TaxID=6336 RepID=A0A0V0S3W3_9BILA|nr:Ribosome biogenesis regulatory -like protein [Trichinella nelsoni]